MITSTLVTVLFIMSLKKTKHYLFIIIDLIGSVLLFMHEIRRYR